MNAAAALYVHTTYACTIKIVFKYHIVCDSYIVCRYQASYINTASCIGIDIETVYILEYR